jgi:hypothetical protein
MNNRLISIVCGTALVLTSSGAVFAAEMPVKAPPPPPPVWEWSGFYIGVGGGFNWTHFGQSLQGVSGTINVVDSTLESLIDSFVGQMSQVFMLPISRCRTTG